MWPFKKRDSAEAARPIEPAPSVPAAAVTLEGYGARVELAAPTFIATIGHAAARFQAEPWDLVTSCWRSGALFNGVIAARPDTEPRFRAARPAPLDAGIEDFGRGPDTKGWRVTTAGVSFPLVELLMFVSQRVSATECTLPVQFLFGAYPHSPEPYNGASETMLTIVGPLPGIVEPDRVTAPNQKLVASDFNSAPFWVENAYLHKRVEWRQRVYWAKEPNILVRYQAPATQVMELERMRVAAVEIAEGIRQVT